jgi:hypothetical protein
VSAFVFGSPEAAEQQFRDEMSTLERETAHLALTDDGEGWDGPPLRGKRAFVFFPADALFPVPCTVFERSGQQVYVCLGKVNDLNSELIWVDASQVTTKSPQRGLFDEAKL